MPTTQDIDILNNSLDSVISKIANPRCRQSAQRMAYLIGASDDPTLALSTEEVNREVAIRTLYSSLEEASPTQPMYWSNGFQDGEPAVTTGRFFSHMGITTYIFAVMTRIPLNTTKAGEIVSCRDISFNTDICFDDFFDRICAVMEVGRQSASLGWRFTTDRRADLSHRLKTPDDVDGAFKSAVDRMRNKRVGKEVIIEIINLVSLTPKFAPDRLQSSPTDRDPHRPRNPESMDAMMP
jgi:hypothetical protein